MRLRKAVTLTLAFALAMAGLMIAVPCAHAGDWYTGTVANPLAGAVIVDTGALPYDNYWNWCIAWSATVNATLLIQHRNAANNATLHEYTVFNLANTAGSPLCTTIPQPPYLLAGERIRVVNASLIALGSVSASIFVGG